MALNIKNAEVERLAAEVAKMAGVSKTEAIRLSLEHEQRKLMSRSERAAGVDRYFKHLEQDVWPNLPAAVRGKGVSKKEIEEILGFGPDGF